MSSPLICISISRRKKSSRATILCDLNMTWRMPISCPRSAVCAAAGDRGFRLGVRSLHHGSAKGTYDVRCYNRTYSSVSTNIPATLWRHVDAECELHHCTFSYARLYYEHRACGGSSQRGPKRNIGIPLHHLHSHGVEYEVSPCTIEQESSLVIVPNRRQSPGSAYCPHGSFQSADPSLQYIVRVSIEYRIAVVTLGDSLLTSALVVPPSVFRQDGICHLMVQMWPVWCGSVGGGQGESASTRPY